LMKKDDDRFLQPNDPNPLAIEDRRGQKFCVSLELDIVFPAHYREFGRVKVGGVLLTIKTEELEHLVFNELELHAVVGAVETSGDIVANYFNAGIVTGAVTIDSIEAPTGNPLNARVQSTLGNIQVSAKTGFVYVEESKDYKYGGGDDDDDDDDEDEEPYVPTHNLHVTSNVGTIDANVAIIEDEELSAHRLAAPGHLVVRTGSMVGRIFNRIDLVDGRALNLNTGSAGGDVAAIVADNYLGHFEVKALLGSTSVEEAGTSPSVIEFEKNSDRVKIGRKVVRTDDGDVIVGEEASQIVIGTTFGHAALQFIDGEDDMWKQAQI